MKRALGVLLLCFLLVGCGGGGGSHDSGLLGGSDEPGSSGQVNGFDLPPTTKADRVYPKLVNYCHMMDLSDNKITNREAYLAQWDIIILNPQEVKDQGVNLTKIRQVNPRIKILAWIPFGQSSEDFEMSTSLGSGLANYYVKDTQGQYISPSWGGHIMNPYKDDYEWAKHVLQYVESNYITNHLYDGVMFDCVWANAPSWYSTYQADIDEDNDYDYQDEQDYQAGVAYLLKSLRAKEPSAIVTANGGVPWSTATTWFDPNNEYYKNVNGVMCGNAFGDEFQVSGWSDWGTQWSYYTGAIDKIQGTSMGTYYYFMNADLRYGRTQAEAQNATSLTDEDKRRFRLALTTTLLKDGYFGFDRGDCLHGQLWWFREYNVNLGNSASQDMKDKYGTGTYSREFANGTVVVNPTNQPMTVTFTEKRTDASTGAQANSFTLPAKDGRIYMKS